MRIALFTNGIWPYVIGGMQKHSYYLVKYFAQQGVEVDLYHMNKSGLDINALEIFTEEEKKYIRSFVFEFPKHGRWPWRYLAESYQYSRILYNHYISQGRPADFIYTKSYTAWYAIQQKRKGTALPPIAIRLHGYEIFQPHRGILGWYRKQLYLPLVLFLNKKADYIYSYGKGISDLIRNRIPGTASKIIEIPSGIEPDWLTPAITATGKRVKFAFLGRYDIRKGVDELSTALKNLISSNVPDFEFNFVGPVPEDKQINHPSIKYWGLIKEKEKIQEILQATDVFVLPSHSEGMPNVILEAMASGCAVIATDVGAVDVMVDNSNGWLVPPLNAPALYEAIKSVLLADGKEILQRRKRSVEKIRNEFLWSRIIGIEINEIKKRLSSQSKSKV